MTSAWTISSQKPLGKPFSLRVWVLAAVACGALAGPGVARAASSPPGVAELTTTINSAFAQVEAVAPGATAAAQPAVQQAVAAVSAASELPAAQSAPAPPSTDSAAAAPPPAPPPAPATAPALTGLAADAVAPVLAAAGVAPPAPAPAQETPAQQTKTVPRRVEASPAPSDPAAAARAGALHSPGTTGMYPQTVPGTGAAPSVAVLTTPRAPDGGSGRASARSPQGGRSSGTAPAGAHPPRPVPPVPPGPTPGFTSPIQAGGSGSFAPLLVAALAAALALASFPFTSRLLPRLAFRKPRRVVLAVWHPG